MRYRAAALVVVAASLAGAAPGAASSPTATPAPARTVAEVAPGTAFEEEPEECLVGTGPTDPAPTGSVLGTEVRLDVDIALDGVDEHLARSAVAVANEAYAPLRLRLVPRFRRVALPSEGRSPSGGPSLSVPKAFDRLKALHRGARPKGTDLVYLMTAKDLYITPPRPPGGPAPGASYAVAGVADCIGGVRYAARAFAIGEAAQERYRFGTVDFDRDTVGRLAAHELGHLLGAHHHLANCAEGDVLRAAGSSHVCTVMLNDLALVGYRFSTANGAVVRGLAERYAAP